MGIMGKLASGFAGNLSEVSPESLMQEFGMYLMDGETITTGFKLIRDVVIVTNRRIIDFDKQGTTGRQNAGGFHQPKLYFPCICGNGWFWRGRQRDQYLLYHLALL